MIGQTRRTADAGPEGLRSNDRAVVAALRRGGRLSRAELASLTGLPKTTVTGVVGRLLRLGVVVEHAADGTGTARSGRPAAGLALAAPAGSVAVLSLTHAGIRAAVVGFDGVIHGRRDIAVGRPRRERQVVERGLDLLGDVIAGLDPGTERVGCAVIGVAAPFEQGVGVVAGRIPDAVVESEPELQEVLHWLHSDPAPAVATRLGVPAMADNDANLGALGEASFGAGRGIGSFVYLKVVEGLGAGLILDGRLYRGARGLAGELAHIQVRDDGAWCTCGGRGCLGDGLGPSLVALQPAYQRPVTLADVIRLAGLGEAGTQRILSDAGRRIGRTLADVCMMLSPEAIVVDGMLGAAARPFLVGMREMIDRHTTSTVAETVQLLPGSLGDQAEILGAAALARDKHLDDQPLAAAGSARR